MIVGIGTDIAELARIRTLLEAHPETFPARFLTKKERLLLAEHPHGAAGFCAGRWAAKEAAAKAMGCGIGEKCALCDLEILNDVSGAPQLTCSGAAAETAKRLGVTRIHLSISHEREYAVATVLLENTQEKNK